MTRILFAPFSILAGVIAGALGKKLFERVWSLIEDSEAPSPKHREIDVWKLIAALALEGLIFRAVRGLVDNASRRAFFRLTGTWPGEEHPEPE
jgi:hypothetical protein